MLLSNVLVKGGDRFSWIQTGKTWHRIVNLLSFEGSKNDGLTNSPLQSITRLMGDIGSEGFILEIT